MVAFSQEIFDRICERIADGESLRTICKGDGMPSKTTVLRMVAADPALMDQYARAREMQADSYFDAVVDIADDEARDPQDRRVAIDARKWAAGKLRPKVYGDRVAIGGDADAPPIRTEDAGVAKLAEYLNALSSRNSG